MLKVVGDDTHIKNSKLYYITKVCYIKYYFINLLFLYLIF